MIKKNYSKTGEVCRATFQYTPQGEAQSVHLCGDFNDWSEDATPLKRRKAGYFSATVSLDAGSQYRFRYLIDGERWENDEAADAYSPNDFGTTDSLVEV